MLPYVNAILSKHGYSEREVGEGVQQQSYNVQKSLLGTQFATGPPRLGWSIHVCAMPDSEERRSSVNWQNNFQVSGSFRWFLSFQKPKPENGYYVYSY